MGARVLIVEDDVTCAKAHALALGSAGFEVDIAFDEASALELVRRWEPEVVLMDMGLGRGGDGAEVAAAVKAAADVPVVFVTGSHAAGDAARAMAQEPHGYLLKPVTADELAIAVRVALLRHHKEAAMRDEAMRDSLTGLYNRRAFLVLVNQHLQVVRRSFHRLDQRRPCALLFFDVDLFKELNDTLGHAAGDAALKQVADAMRASFRAQDVLARYGGDEFAALAVDAGDKGEHVRQRLLSALPAHLSLSVGAVALNEREPLERLLEPAAAAMYDVKKARKAERKLRAP